MRLSDLADDASRVLDWVERGTFLEGTLRLGVTGLSRSGKTVFITALVNNLLRRGRLPQLAAAADGRLQAAVLRPQPDPGVARFDYERHLAALTGSQPHWPAGTDRVSQLRVSLRYSPSSWMARQFMNQATLNLDIVDYPGEWLLDLPLLRLDYETWATRTIEGCGRPPRATLAEDWLRVIGEFDPEGPEDEEAARCAADAFTAYLRRARSEGPNLAALPPGRFLLPGEMEGSPALTFCPLPGQDRPRRGTLRGLMAERYRAYLDHVVKPFYRNHFAKLDRQIVLVDLMAALNAGPDSWDDLETAMTDILESFRHGGDSWFNTLIGGRITRILFAATKADQLHHSQHDRLEALMRSLVHRAMDKAVYEGAEVRVMALSALRATVETTVKRGGEPLPCIEGRLLGARDDPVAVFPGHLPDRAEAAFPEGRANPDRYQFASFEPPADIDTARGLPHLRLDRALDYLIGPDLG